MIQNLDPKIGGFFLLTGFSFIAFASGFSVCLFDMDKVNECAEVSALWLDRFNAFGSHIIDWAFALFRAIMTRQG